jgi:signal transduction histidine kinase
LRNPLTALRTFGKLLLKRFANAEDDRLIVEGMLRESDRLQQLLESFESETTHSAPILDNPGRSLALAAAPLPLETVEIGDILAPLIVSATAIAQERLLDLHSHIPPALPPVRVNTAALREAFTNLLDNALKYTPSGGEISIVVQVEPSSERLGIVIADTGYGIPPQAQAHLFERHYRGIQASSDIPGTGLGLAIAKSLVEQMHGSIEVISPNPQSLDPNLPGTVFIIWLPQLAIGI